MSARVRIAGDLVIKRLGEPEAVDRLIDRARTLRAAGVMTPVAHPGALPVEVTFHLIAGEGGLEMILEHGASALGPLLGSAAPLHRSTLPELAPFDPLARISPRLADSDAPWIRTWIDRYLPAVTGGAPVHGDLHAGQFIRDAEGQVWLLDLDDLATGPREVDLGNFAAHLATRPETARGAPVVGFRSWLDEVMAHAPDADAELAMRHGKIALLRRALKLAERGDEAVLDALRQS